MFSPHLLAVLLISVIVISTSSKTAHTKLLNKLILDLERGSSHSNQILKPVPLGDGKNNGSSNSTSKRFNLHKSNAQGTRTKGDGSNATDDLHYASASSDNQYRVAGGLLTATTMATGQDQSSTANPLSAASISLATMLGSSQDSQSSTEYATVKYNGLIGVNTTDPFTITTESRSFTLPIEVQILMCLFYGALCFTAVTSNMIVCYIVLSNQRMRTATNYFIVNLAVGDILMALLCIPFTFPANLIFLYWPFGFSLCVIVSYSQANSVFISAYTMVAISIDKYIAIMYPMRLRMPKNQAKVIILVIWSAALLTSLPTALLSSLAPASPDMGQPQTTIAMEAITPTTSPSIVAHQHNETSATTRAYQTSSQTGHNSQEITSRILSDDHQQRRLSMPPSRGNLSESNPSSKASSVSPATPNQHQEQRREQYEEHKKYFCQESWNFWPQGKYYYSMALTVLQFALPLFVLVVTYTRIVVIVWGKRMPGEEDNARDARLARSKRKMIKMVIFCVIAFALTWLPFNALIILGDTHPDIWENQSIMYIWFMTHYLAMCHTITNPLIYIWMNNRFRAGFKQVIGDVCNGLHRLSAFVLCYCLCLGCCFNCSRQKLARVELDINRKRAGRGPLTSSGSLNPYNTNNTTTTNNNSNNENNGNSSSKDNDAASHQQYNYTTTRSGEKTAKTNTSSNNSHQTTTTTTGLSTAANIASRGATSDAKPLNAAGVEVSIERRARPSSRIKRFTMEASPSTTTPEDRQGWGQIRASQPAIELDAIASANSQARHGDDSAETRLMSGNGAAQATGSGASPTSPKWIRLFRRAEPRPSPGDGGPAAKVETEKMIFGELDRKLLPQAEQRQAASRRQASAGSGQQLAGRNRKKRRKERGHVINLQMTISQVYQPQAFATTLKQKDTCSAACKPAGGRAKARHSGSANCPNCRRADANPAGRQPVRFDEFLVDLRNSSQSSATMSAQTNNTSLAISPILSQRGNSNSTLSSLSAYDHASGRGSFMDASGGSSKTGSPPPANDSTNVDVSGDSGAQTTKANESRVENESAQIDEDQAVPDGSCERDGLKYANNNDDDGELGLPSGGHQRRRGRSDLLAGGANQMVAINGTVSVVAGARDEETALANRLLDGEIDGLPRESAGTLSGATSLESSSGGSECTGANESGSNRADFLGGTGEPRFCRDRRQTASAAEVGCHLRMPTDSRIDYPDTNAEFCDNPAAANSNKNNSGSNNNSRNNDNINDDELADAKSSSTFELVSAHLLRDQRRNNRPSSPGASGSDDAECENYSLDDDDDDEQQSNDSREAQDEAQYGERQSRGGDSDSPLSGLIELHQSDGCHLQEPGRTQLLNGLFWPSTTTRTAHRPLEEPTKLRMVPDSPPTSEAATLSAAAENHRSPANSARPRDQDSN